MAYSGFLSDEDYARKSLDETINGKWVFKDQVEFEKLIKGTTYASYYADLAEYYECESNELIPIGTLVSFGGKKEITKTSPNSRSYFGIVSTSPAFVLNEKELGIINNYRTLSNEEKMQVETYIQAIIDINNLK